MLALVFFLYKKETRTLSYQVGHPIDIQTLADKNRASNNLTNNASKTDNKIVPLLLAWINFNPSKDK